MCYILLIMELHVSAGSGHHQVLSIQNTLRWCSTVLQIINYKKRSLESNETPVLYTGRTVPNG